MKATFYQGRDHNQACILKSSFWISLERGLGKEKKRYWSLVRDLGLKSKWRVMEGRKIHRKTVSGSRGTGVRAPLTLHWALCCMVWFFFFTMYKTNSNLLKIIWGRVKEEGNQLTQNHIRPRSLIFTGKEGQGPKWQELARFWPAVQFSPAQWEEEEQLFVSADSRAGTTHLDNHYRAKR